MCGLTLQICVKILSGFQTIISCVWVIAYSTGEIISCEAAEGQRNGNQTKWQIAKSVKIKDKASWRWVNFNGTIALTLSPIFSHNQTNTR